VVGAWLKELLGLPARASFAIVTGCQMANVTCLAAARHRLLAGGGWDAEQNGLFGAPPIRVLAGHTRHGSIDRALRLLGVGRSQIVELISGLVRFLCPRPEATPEDHDRFTDGTIAAIAAEGKAFFSGTTWRGRRAMRISVCSWRTSSDDVRRTVASVAAVLADRRDHELSQ
jgi:glutamate/tyrosine decarboxylase-like PLP-dependent enzyme